MPQPAIYEDQDVERHRQREHGHCMAAHQYIACLSMDELGVSLTCIAVPCPLIPRLTAVRTRRPTHNICHFDCDILSLISTWACSFISETMGG